MLLYFYRSNQLFMVSSKKYFLLFAIILFSVLVHARNNFFQQDTFHVKDGVVSKDILSGDIEEDCFEKFFDKAEKLQSPGKTILISKPGKTQTVSSFMKNDEMGEESRHGLIDLDNDGKKEIVI